MGIESLKEDTNLGVFPNPNDVPELRAEQVKAWQQKLQGKNAPMPFSTDEFITDYQTRSEKDIAENTASYDISFAIQPDFSASYE